MKTIYCQACNQYYEIEEHLPAASYQCPQCQRALMDAPVAVPPPVPVPAAGSDGGNYGLPPSSQSHLAYCLLGLFFGSLGIHNFYSGHNKQGLAKLLLTVLLGWSIVVPLGVLIWTLVDILTVKTDSEGRPFANTVGCLGIGAIMLIFAVSMTAIIGVPAGMLLPALSNAREEARRISCSSNLKQLGLAYLMYCDDHHEQPPPSMELLFPYVGYERPFQCPSAPPEAGRQSYFMVVYPFTSDKMSSPSTTPVIIEAPRNHKKFVNVSFADGHVESKFAQVDSFQELMPHFSDVEEPARSVLEQQLRQWDENPQH
jgi:prepilin-type processing-associated H-X9-DG protein